MKIGPIEFPDRQGPSPEEIAKQEAARAARVADLQKRGILTKKNQQGPVIEGKVTSSTKVDPNSES